MNRLLIIYQLDNSCIPEGNTGIQKPIHDAAEAHEGEDIERGILMFKHRRD